MDNLFKVIIFTGALFIGETSAMNNDAYWQEVMSRTKTKFFEPMTNGYSEDAENALGAADVRIDWEKIQIAAEKGNRLAQYVHSQHLFALSKHNVNNEDRRELRFKAYMYLLIAALKGKLPQAIESFNYSVDFTYKIPDLYDSKLRWIISEADKLSRE